MSGVFISYRREDSAGWAGRINDHMKARLGADHVFMDIIDIPIGSDFTQIIDQTLGRVGAVVVIIGQRWLSAVDEAGALRIDDPEDFVHREIAASLERGVTVIPVLVDGAEMPARGDLPENLRDLALRNAVVVTDTHFRHDIERLLAALELVIAKDPPAPPAVPPPSAPPPRPGPPEMLAGPPPHPGERLRIPPAALIGGAVAIVAALVITLVLLSRGDDASTAPTTTITAATTTTAPATTTTAETTATTEALGALSPPPADTSQALPHAGGELARGSGCVLPSGGGALPDGTWFGFVAGRTDVTAGVEFELDLACLYTGGAATREVDADWAEWTSADGVAIRNTQHWGYSATATSATVVFWLDGERNHHEAWFDDWLGTTSCGFSPCAVWFEVEAGLILTIQEQDV